MLVVPKVFVSSTKIDLEEYRAAIAMHLPRLDVLFRGMELFGARTIRPEQTMLNEVADCDAFVGILGFRYGSRHESGKSYTELEYRKALGHGLPVFMFLADESHRCDPKLRERDDSVDRLIEFKREVERERTIEKFGSPEDLALKVSNSLQRWLDGNRWVRGEMLVAASPPTESTRRNIRLLYSENEREVIRACEALARSRQAVEHFYALVRCRKESDDIRDAVFRILSLMPAECLRVEQVLEEFVQDDNVQIRRRAARAICNRARRDEPMVIPESLARAVLTGAADKDDETRYEIAHALPKVAGKFPLVALECKERLRELAESDGSSRVREQARQSLLDMV